MQSFRDQFRGIARHTLHQRLKVPAAYFPWPYDPATARVEWIGVRLFENDGLAGDVKGTNLTYVQAENESPEIIFDIAEAKPLKGYAVSLDEGVAYLIESVRPTHGGFAKARVKKLAEAKLAGVPNPKRLVCVATSSLPSMI